MLTHGCRLSLCRGRFLRGRRAGASRRPFSCPRFSHERQPLWKGMLQTLSAKKALQGVFAALPADALGALAVPIPASHRPGGVFSRERMALLAMLFGLPGLPRHGFLDMIRSRVTTLDANTSAKTGPSARAQPCSMPAIATAMS